MAQEGSSIWAVLTGGRVIFFSAIVIGCFVYGHFYGQPVVFDQGMALRGNMKLVRDFDVSHVVTSKIASVRRAHTSHKNSSIAKPKKSQSANAHTAERRISRTDPKPALVNPKSQSANAHTAERRISRTDPKPALVSPEKSSSAKPLTSKHTVALAPKTAHTSLSNLRTPERLDSSSDSVAKRSWLMNFNTSDHGPLMLGYSCVRTCAEARSFSTCDNHALRSLNTEASVRVAFEAAGFQCTGLTDGSDVIGEYDGPWTNDPSGLTRGSNLATGSGNCGYSSSSKAQFSCGKMPGLGFVRVCPCKKEAGHWIRVAGAALPIPREGDLVFDCGASFGPATEAFIKGWKARVLTVEANQEWIDGHILKNINQTGLQHLSVKVVNAALADKDGEVTFYVSCNPYLSSTRLDWLTNQTMRFAGLHNEGCEIRPVRTKTRSLDSLISEFGAPKFIKVDVEGFEETALRGLTQLVPLLCWEWTYPETFADALRMLRRLWSELGFRAWALRFGDQPFIATPEAASFRCIGDLDETTLRETMIEGPSEERGPVGMLFVAAALPDGAMIRHNSKCRV